MRFSWILPLALLIAPASGFADQAGRLDNAATVLHELRATPDKDVPSELWEKATCVAVIPSVKKAAFIVGGEYGRGVMSCREHGRWSAPMFLMLEKGSWGFQAGAESIDLVLLMMNRGGVDKLLANKVSLGADASAAAGPLGRSAHAATDAQMKAEILVLARAGGLRRRQSLGGRAEARHRCQQRGLRACRDAARHPVRHDGQATGRCDRIHERSDPEHTGIEVKGGSGFWVPGSVHRPRSGSTQPREPGARHRR